MYATSWKYERLKTGCMRIRDWIVRMQSECALNRRNMIIRYNLKDNRSEDEGQLELLFTGETSNSLSDEQDYEHVYLPRDIEIISVSFDAYYTYYNDKITVAIRRDGFITPHLVQVGIVEEGIPTHIYTLEVMALTGQVNIYPEKIGWEDLE